MADGTVRGRGRLRRRLGYIGPTLRARSHRGPRPLPDDDEAWVHVLEGWLDRQAAILVADVEDDLAGRPTPAPDLVGRSRRLWSLAHLHRHGRGGAAVADALAGGWEMLERHADHEHGGWMWTIDPTTGIATDTRKVLYGQCGAVYALAEVALAGGARALGARAEAEAALARAAGRVTVHGAVAELLDREWTPLPSGTAHRDATAGVVSVGGQLHLFEAAALLVAAGGGSGVVQVARRAARLLEERFLGADGATLTDEAGAVLPAPVSLGHRIEAAWLLAEGAERVGLEGARDRSRRVVEDAVESGFRHGAQDDQPWPCFRLGGRQRVWWVQVELLRALVEFDEGPGHRGTLTEVLEWLHHRQVDPATGQARQLMTHWGAVLVTGDSTSARTGYHDTRAYVAAANLLAGR